MARKRPRKRNTLLDFLDILTALGLKLGAVAFVLALAYLIYGLTATDGFTKVRGPDRLRVIANVVLFTKILGVSGTVLVLSAAFRYYAEETLGYIMSIFGVLLYFGTPWLFSNWYTAAGLRTNFGVALVVSELRLLGAVLFAPGIVLILRDIAIRISYATGKPKEKEKKDGAFLVGEATLKEEEPYRPRLYAKCWQMPYCRQFVRTLCPSYEARQSCWRRKAGCYCDEGTILRAIRSQGKAGRMFAKDVTYRMGSLPSQSKLTPAQKRALCRSCVIYQLHQQQKYRIFSPLVFPAAAALIWLLYPTIVTAFRAIVQLTDKLSFTPHAYTRAPGVSGVPEFVLVLFVVWLGIVAISYGLHLVEFCVFKMQI